MVQMAKKIVIIGATSGIGLGLARKFAQKGYLVGVTGRRKHLLENVREENPHAYFIQEMDIVQTNATLDRLNHLKEVMNGIDMLVMNAGIGHINRNLMYSLEKEVLETNVTGFVNVVTWAYHSFKEQGFGHLIAITSIGGLRGNGSAPSYNGSKAFQLNYLEGLRIMAKKESFNLHITDIRPGLVDTAMAKGDKLFWLMPVEKAVEQMFRAIKRKKKVAYITRRWRPIAFLLKILPRSIYDNISA